MKTKSFLASKINWVAIILIIVALIPVIEDQNFSGMGVKEWTTFILGIAVIVLRIWFTNTTIKSTKKIPKSKIES